MAETIVNLGMLPNNRGDFDDLPSGALIYKDNIVQYNGSSYIYQPADFDIEHPEESATTSAPYDDNPSTLNTGWKVFASGNNTFTTGEKVENVGIDNEPTAGSENIPSSGGCYKKIIDISRKIGYTNISIDECDKKNFCITATNWYSTGQSKHVVIPAVKDTVFKLTCHGENITSANVAWLTSDYIPPVDRTPIPFVTGTGVIQVQKETETQIIAPEGTAYLAITIKDGGNNVITWDIYSSYTNSIDEQILQLVNSFIPKVDFLSSPATLIINNNTKTFNLDGKISYKPKGGGIELSNKIIDLTFGTALGYSRYLALVIDTTTQNCVVREFSGRNILNSDVIVCLYEVEFGTIQGNRYPYIIKNVIHTLLNYEIRNGNTLVKKNVTYQDIVEINDLISEVEGDVSEVEYDVKSLNTTISGINENITSILPSFEMGYISSTGGQGSANNVARSTDYIDVKGANNIYAEGDLSEAVSVTGLNINKIRLNIHCYDANKNSIGRTIHAYQNINDGFNFTLRDNTKYVKLTLGFNDSPIDFNSQLLNINAHITDIFEVVLNEVGLLPKVEKIESVTGANNSMVPYEGNRILLNNYADFKELFALRDAGAWNQGATIYDKYLFQFHTGNAVIDMYDLETKGLVQSINVSENPEGSENHANSVCFGVDFADENDLFPLIYVSTYTDGGIWVYRFTGTIGNLSISKYQIINFIQGDDTCYLPSFSIDIENNKLIAVGYNMNSNQDVSGNGMRLCVFELPNKSGDKNLSASNMLWRKSLKYTYAIQGGMALLGKVFTLYGESSHSCGLKVLDYVNGIVLNNIKFTSDVFGNYFEPEGLGIYDRKLIITNTTKALEFSF